MSYQYSRLPCDLQRDVAHWRGAKGGMRVLSLPTCAGWLQRQANDASYDFWAELALVAPLPTPAPVPSPAPAAATEVLILQKDADGSWLSYPWQSTQAANIGARTGGVDDATRFIIEISANRR